MRRRRCNDYLTVINRKTASLFWAGGTGRGGPRGWIAGRSTRWGSWAPRWACAFQMVDDLLDVIGPEEKIGKPVGSDLRAGIPSLPVVLGVERSAELRACSSERYADGRRGVRSRTRSCLRDPEIDRRRAPHGRGADRDRAIDRRRAEPSPIRDGLAMLIDDQVSREV